MNSSVSIQIANRDEEGGRRATEMIVIFAALSLSAVQLESNE